MSGGYLLRVAANIFIYSASILLGVPSVQALRTPALAMAIPLEQCP